MSSEGDLLEVLPIVGGGCLGPSGGCLRAPSSQRRGLHTEFHPHVTITNTQAHIPLVEEDPHRPRLLSRAAQKRRRIMAQILEEEKTFLPSPPPTPEGERKAREGSYLSPIKQGLLLKGKGKRASERLVSLHQGRLMYSSADRLKFHSIWFESDTAVFHKLPTTLQVTRAPNKVILFQTASAVDTMQWSHAIASEIQRAEAAAKAASAPVVSKEVQIEDWLEELTDESMPQLVVMDTEDEASSPRSPSKRRRRRRERRKSLVPKKQISSPELDGGGMGHPPRPLPIRPPPVLSFKSPRSASPRRKSSTHAHPSGLSPRPLPANSSPDRPRYLKDRIRRSLSLDHTQERSIASLIYRRGRGRGFSRTHGDSTDGLPGGDDTLKIRVAQKTPKAKRSFGGHALSLGKLIIGPFRRKSKVGGATSDDLLGSGDDSLDKQEVPLEGDHGLGALALSSPYEPQELACSGALGRRSPPLRSPPPKQVTHADRTPSDSAGDAESSDVDPADMLYMPATRKPRRSRDRKYRSDEPTKNGRFVPESIQESKLPMETLGGGSSSSKRRKFSDPGLVSPRSRKRHSLDGELGAGPSSRRPIRKRSSLRYDDRPTRADSLFRGGTPSSSKPSSSKTSKTNVNM